MNKVDNFLEVVWFRLVNLLITREYSDLARGISDSNSSSILRPAQAIDWAVVLSDLLADDWHLSIAIDVPYVDKAVSIARSKHARMLWTPLNVVHVFLGTLKRHQRLCSLVWTPHFDRPIH